MAVQRSADRVLTMLRDSGSGAGVAEIAAGVGLSVSTTRFHLDHLLAAGRVRAAVESAAGPGRPKLQYRAVLPEAVEDAAAYQLLAGLLAEQLAEGGGTAEQARARWAETLLQRAGSAGELPADLIESVLLLLGDSGFEPERVGKRPVIALHRCPFAAIVANHAQVVCGVHASLIAALLSHLGAPAKVTLTAVKSLHRPCQVKIELGAAPEVRLVVA